MLGHRADDSGLSEQKRLEGLIVRYKSMMPVIEVTMLRIEVYTRGFAYKEQGRNSICVEISRIFS